MTETGNSRPRPRGAGSADRKSDRRPAESSGWARRHPVWTTLIVLAVIVLVIPAIVVAIAYNRIEVPGPGSVATNQISEIYDADGSTLMGRIVPPEGNRTDVALDEIPVYVRNAVIAAEDRSFYTNEGFDPVGIARAAIGQLTGEASKGGGSTITQQYVKNTVVGDEYSYDRKAKEILIAAKMTSQWSKDQILEAYLNTIYFGRGAYGIAAAAKAYFNKPINALTVEEGAVLASSIQSPSALDPRSNRAGAEARWNYVLDGMVESGSLPRDQRAAAVYPQVVEDPQAIEQNVGDTSNGAIRRQVLAELQQSGIDEQMLNTRGLKITTTIDAKTQAAVVEGARKNMVGESPDIRTAVVSINPRTGGVIGYYGGEEAEGWDYANAPLQTGSAFKVFGLAAALDQGIPLSRQYSSAPVATGNVTVNNAEGNSCGTCSIATALKMSLNTSFIRLQSSLKNGAKDVQQMAYRVGIPKQIPGLPYDTLTEQGKDPYDGLILGQYPIRVRDMATGISTFAADGVHRPTHFIQKVEAADGEVLLDNTDVKGEQVLSENVTSNLSSAMLPIAAYSRGHALAGGRPSASKSGTTQLGDTGNNKDAWFVGYTPSIATAVWVGTDDNKPLYNASGGIMYGSSLPADIWKSAMDGALEGSTWESFPQPGSIGGQAGAPAWDSYSGNSYGNGQGSRSQSTEAPQPESNEPQQAPEPVAPQAPPLTLNVPGLPEIVIPGMGAPQPGGGAPAGGGAPPAGGNGGGASPGGAGGGAAPGAGGANGGGAGGGAGAQAGAGAGAARN